MFFTFDIFVRVNYAAYHQLDTVYSEWILLRKICETFPSQVIDSNRQSD
jgi:hypothetical protein